MGEVVPLAALRDCEHRTPSETLQRIVVGIGSSRRDDLPDDETYNRFEKLMKGTTILTAKDAGTIEATTSQ
jgi:hypothetical protein